MPLHLSFFKFLLKHPLAILGSLVVHASIVGSFWYSSQHSETKRIFNLAQLQEKPDTQNNKNKEKPEEEIKQIQAEAVNSQDIEKQIELLKKQRSDKKSAELKRIRKIEKRQKQLKKEELKIAKEKQRLEKTRKKEEQNIAKQKKEAQKLEKNLKKIQKEEKDVAKRLESLQKQTKQTKKANKEAIKVALKQQRELEKKRTQEELRIEQAKQKQALLEKQKKKATENLQKLSKQQEKTVEKLLESEVKKKNLENANRQQLSLLKKQYTNTIRIQVKSKWRRPVNTQNSWKCEVAVQQTARGEVEKVIIKNCTEGASQRFKESVEKAVYRADPLPIPPDIRVFDKNINFIFKP